MSLRSAYEDFLHAPNPLALSETIFLCYTTTAKSFAKPEPVIRHLVSQNKNVVRKKSENVIEAVEGHNALVLVTETAVEFLTGGGAYLPGLENFVADKVATIPVTHFVHFDADGKITQIRLAWDQASLLKHVEVIGSRGNNWPIVEGSEQCALLSPSAALRGEESEDFSNSRGRDTDEPARSERSISPSKKHIKDPYSSLNLFDANQNEEVRRQPTANTVSPRISARPPPREMSELFAAGHEDFEPSTENGGSPKKIVTSTVVAPKGAGGRKFGPSRLFEDDADEESSENGGTRKTAPSNVAAPKGADGKTFAPSRLFEDDPDSTSPAAYKSDPRKYNHFSIGDEVENDPFQRRSETEQSAKQAPLKPQPSRNLSQWDFQDFNTPEKVPQKSRSQDAVHFSFGDEDPNDRGNPGKPAATTKNGRDLAPHFEFQDSGTPISRLPVHQPRPDNNAHFEFKDEGTPAHPRVAGAGRGTTVAKNMGLYQNNVDHYEDEAQDHTKSNLSKMSNNAGRNKQHLYQNNVDHYEDEQPDHTRSNLSKMSNNANRNKQHLYQNNIDQYDDEESDHTKAPLSQITNNVGRKKDFDNHWAVSDSSRAVEKGDENKAIASDQKTSSWDTYDKSPDKVKKPLSHIATGRTRMESHFSIGDDEESTPKAIVSRNQEQRGFWDF